MTPGRFVGAQLFPRERSLLYHDNFSREMRERQQESSRRLIEERLNLDGTKRWTNSFTYDGGQSSGSGVLTKTAGSSSTWSGTGDALSRINSETNSAVRRPAWGAVNGPATVSTLIDGQPMPVTLIGTQALSWRATLELSSGTHELRVSALHPSGQYTAWATNWFTNSATSDTISDAYDSSGNITQRLWKNGSGQTNRTQTLSWDARGRLLKVVDRDSTQSGRDWSAVYDSLNRLLRTTEVPVTNGTSVALILSSSTTVTTLRLSSWNWP